MTKLINVPDLIPAPFYKKLYGACAPAVERFMGIEYINRLYETHQDTVKGYCEAPKPDYFDYLLNVLEARVFVDAAQLARIPETGTVIIAANHPFGAIDGIAMASLVLKRRHDMRLMSTHFLELIPGLKPWLCSVDPFETPYANKLNISGMKRAYAWLNAGGCIASFPSGTVSHYTFKKGRVEDPDWHPNLARLARKTQAIVVPIFFEGHNSWLSQIAGLVNSKLRTALLGRELKKHNKVINAIIGEPILPAAFEAYPSDRALSAFIRSQCYDLRR